MDEENLNTTLQTSPPSEEQGDEARLNALENEISQAQQSLERDFAAFAADKLNDENLEELFFEDKEAFIREILTLQNEFLSGLQGKINEAKALRGQIDEKKAFSSIQAAADAFDAKNMGISSDELLDYFQNDLSPREKKEIENLEPEAFFETLFKKKQGNNRTSENESLPSRLNGSGANVEGGSEEVLTRRF